MEKIRTMKLREKNGRIHQTDARELKAEIHKVVIDQLVNMGELITEIQNGFVIEFTHDTLGSIPVEVKCVIKNTNFDVVTAGEEFTSKLASEKNKKKDK